MKENSAQMSSFRSDDFYELMWTDRKDIRFYQQICKTYGPRILELGCGTGRILTQIAPNAERVVGMDLNDYRIELCRKRVETLDGETKDKISLFVGNMMNFSVQEKFSLITMPFRGFQHLLRIEDQVETMTNISRFLEEGGHVLIDIFNPHPEWLKDDTRKQEMTGSEFDLQDGIKVIQKDRVADIDYNKQVITAEEIHYIKRPDGYQERIMDTYKVRYTFYDELAAVVKSAGLDVVETYGDYNFSRFEEQANPSEILMLCRLSPK